MIIGHGVLRQALLQKHFLVSLRIPGDYSEDFILQSLVEVGGLKTVRIENGRVALLGSGFLFQSLEQSAAVAVTAEARMDPEITNLHALTPDCAHDPAHQAAVDVAEPDGHVSTCIDGRGSNVVGDEFVA